ncbi:hypothetical protein ACRALDRAFT_1062765 [Sodiomyces alcalophilus JCM 7366]|uniref:uncharacterized protein n=1 Tax=Sodiomyces alcalophilus JCM 7366 TaxID=591952 RepID=UPI0039B6B464
MPVGFVSASTLASLLHASTINDHTILEAANAALRDSRPHPHTVAAKVIALLRLDQFEDALRALAEAGSDAEETWKLERSYALYKTGDLDGASALTQLPLGRCYSHIAAQVAYRAGRFREASTIYTALASSVGAAAEESDLAINSLAVTAQRNWESAAADNDVQTSVFTAPESFELAYNMACCSISQGEFLKALSFLSVATRLCTTSDDLSEEERLAEMVPILIQEMYTYSRLGNQAEAQRVFGQLLSYGFEDDEIKLVMENNSLVFHTHGGNAFSILRRVERGLGLAKPVQLFRHQEIRLERNKFAIALLAQKFSGVVRKSRWLLEVPARGCSDALVLSSINAAASSLRGSGELSLRGILAVTTVRPFDIGSALIVIQLYAALDRTEAALSTLQVLFDGLEKQNNWEMRYSPGLVSLAVALYGLRGRLRCRRAEISRASLYWMKKDNAPRMLLRSAGADLLRSPSPSDLATARADFETIHHYTTEDPIVTAGLVASFATDDEARVGPFINDIPAAADLVRGADVQSLVNASVVLTDTDLAATARKRLPDIRHNQTTRQRRRKRNLHKICEEGRTLDPDRWLPLRDRVSYRQKGKKPKRRVNENTQGGVIKGEEMLELAGGAGSVRVQKSRISSGLSNGKKKKKAKN